MEKIKTISSMKKYKNKCKLIKLKKKIEFFFL